MLAVRARGPTSLATGLKRCYSSATGPEGRYIQKGVVPTFHYQPSLPRLPIPKLEETLSRYVAAVQPLVTPEEFKATTAAVDSFRATDGPRLHAALVDRDANNKRTSYISAPWFDMYLESRAPLPINFNPFIAFQDDPIPARNTQAARAANLILASVRFRNSLADQVLEPDVFHLNPEKSDTPLFKNLIRFVPSSVSWFGAYMVNAYPLDMSQYHRLFASTRVPRKGKDELVSNKDATHVAIMRRGHVYTFDVMAKDGTPFSAGVIRDNIDAILKDNIAPAEHPIGLLTTEERDTWAAHREQLAAANPEQMKALDGALFVVSLDDESPTKDTDLSRLLLTSDGKNRWFDKSFSMLISGNGKAAINFEHAWGDGVAVLRYFNEIHRDATTVLGEPTPAGSGAKPRRLDFNVPDSVREGIRVAGKKFDAIVNSLDIKTLEYFGFGKAAVKGHKLSPDGVTQMAFQLAYYLHEGRTVSTYESCSTAAFKHGRTECIRSATSESVDFVRAITSTTSSSADRLAALRKAVEKHSELTKNAAMGKGVDRHLYAMLDMTRRAGEPTPLIFKDKGYATMGQNILSTSTLASPALLVGGFGPVHPEGYGVGYMIDDKRIGCHVTSFRKDTPEFLQSLHKAIELIRATVEAK